MSERSVIHDIGYRRYTGVRLGRGYAARSLFEHGVRVAFGLGRSAKAKIFPWIVIGLVTALAVVIVAVKAQSGEMIISYQELPGTIAVLMMVFLAVVAPELVSRDLRNQTLPLYFSRPVGRADYALAKLAALATAVWLLQAGAQLLMFLGSAFTAPDAAGIAAEARGMLGGWVVSGVYTIVFSSLALLIASVASRRAFAAGAIVAVFMITLPVAELIKELGQGGTMSQVGSLFSPFSLPEGVREWLFGGNSVVIGPYGPLYGAAALLLTAACTLLLVLRYRKVSL